MDYTILSGSVIHIDQRPHLSKAVLISEFPDNKKKKHTLIIKDKTLINQSRYLKNNDDIKVKGYLTYHSFIVPDTTKKIMRLEFIVTAFL